MHFQHIENPFSNSVKKYIIFTLLFLVAAMSCTQKERELTPEELATQDSLALHIAVMPTTDCLPLYLAAECGIADSLGLTMRLHTYLAQMDVDTAIQKGHVTVAYSDLIRAIRLNESTDIKAIMKGSTSMSLLTIKGKRVSKIHQMKERMVAISRLSVTDYWCDNMLDSAFMLKEDVYRPQVHDIQLRTEMVRTGLIDAAILPEPYSQWMKFEGNNLIYTSPQEGPHLTAWIVRSDSTLDAHRHEQIRLMVQAYDIAAKQMNDVRHQNTVRRILQSQYKIAPEVVDSIQVICPKGAELPDSLALKKAADFLQARERMPKNVVPDSLIWNTFIRK